MIYAVILAAGASSRMEGKPKALLRDSRNVTYLSRIASTAREGGAGGIIVVVGAPHADVIKKALPRQCTGVLIWPVDVPFVKAATVRALIEHRAGRIAVPRHQSKGGHPVRIPRPFFADVMGLADGDMGLKALYDARPNLVERVDVDDAAVLVDVDTPADAAAAEERAAGSPAKKK
jgi:CTP:molybdopterin cytidylyltransferase MocA